VCSVSGKVECFIDDPEFHLPSAEGLLSVPLPDVVATVTEHGISAGSEQWSHESQLVYFRLMNYLKFRANYFTEIDQPEAAADAVRQAFSVRSALMIANYKLIPYVLRRRAAGGEIRRRLQDREVLKSFAEEGLLKAVDAYDWKIGARFATFACLCISHEISTGFARLKKLADAVQIAEQKRMEGRGDFWQSVAAAECDVLGGISSAAEVASLLTSLHERDRVIVAEYFGVGAEGRTASQIADRLGVATHAVYDRIQFVLERLRQVTYKRSRQLKRKPIGRWWPRPRSKAVSPWRAD
jgi:DNA-directed RNA polymerase specialized sigma subunit